MSLITKNKKINKLEFTIVSSFFILISFIIISYIINSDRSCTIITEDSNYTLKYDDIESIDYKRIAFKSNNNLITLEGDYVLECYK